MSRISWTNNDAVFSPSFGNRPKELIGRGQILADVLDGLRSFPGSKGRATLLLGQRGYGKTVLLLELAELARKEGYVVASPTITSAGMLERIVEKIQQEGESLVPESMRKLSGGSVGFLGFSVGLQFTESDQRTKTFPFKLAKLTTALNEKGRGVLILVDEVQGNNEALKELIIAYQELVGEGRDIAVVFAGLPGAISSILNDRVLTFLNRANKITLDPLSYLDIDAYYLKAFQETGVQLSNEMRKKAVQCTDGSPYMMQLIGHSILAYARENGELDELLLENAVSAAREEFMNDICKTQIDSLTGKDLAFLKAMAQDQEKSKIGDVVKRMGVTPDYAQTYKRRLIDAGIIKQERRGEVQFAVPYLRDYLIQGNE